jgi:hypothetical protein
MHRLTRLNCPITVSGSKSFEQAALFRILRSACGSNRAACQVMIDAAGPLSQDNPRHRSCLTLHMSGKTS